MRNQTIDYYINRKIDNCAISINIVSIKLNLLVKEDSFIEDELFLLFYSSLDGKRKFLSSCLKSKLSKTSDWYDFFQSLISKGLQNVFYAVIPNDDYLSKALKLSFKNIIIFFSHFDTINKLSKYYSSSYSDNLFSKVINLFLAKDIDSFDLLSNVFKENYLTCDFLKDLFDTDLKFIRQYSSYDYNLRKFIFSFYFYRDNLKHFRALSNSKSTFSSPNEYLSLLVDDLNRIESKIACTKSELKYIIDFLYKSKKDLIISSL